MEDLTTGVSVDDGIRVVPINSALVQDLWPEVEPLISKACDQTSGRYRPENVLEHLLNGRMTLVCIFDGPTMIGAMAVEVVIYPNANALRVVFMGGERWLQYQDRILEVLDAGARNIGCRFVEMEGRPGWEKYLKGKASKISIVLEREVA